MSPRRFVVLLLLALFLPVGLAGAARAQALDAEDGFTTRVAQERSSRGLAAYMPAADLQAVARRHAQRMADRGEPFHNPALGSEVSGWSMLAENVGVGPDVERLHQMFMASSDHRQNILSPELTEIGVGVVRGADGTLWVVQVFRRPDAAPAPAPQPAPQPAPSPPPTAPPSAPAPAPPPPVVAAAVPPAPTPTTLAPPESAPVPAATPGVRPGRAVGAAEVAARAGAVGQLAVTDSAALGAAPDLAAVARQVPAAAWAAALLLAFVVGLQGQVLRRLGLVA